MCRIKKAYDLLGVTYRVLAPTGCAAANVNGYTIHTTFKHIDDTVIPVKNIDRKRRYLIDEKSMIGKDLLRKISYSLGGTQDFGQHFIALFGDFRQLGPVKDDYMFTASQFTYFKHMVLHTNHRQGNELFATALNNLYDGTLTTDMINILQQCTIKYTILSTMKKEAMLHLFHSNKQVNHWNTQCERSNHSPSITYTVIMHSNAIRIAKRQCITRSVRHSCNNDIHAVYMGSSPIDDSSLDNIRKVFLSPEKNKIQEQLRTDLRKLETASVTLKQNYRIMITRNIYKKSGELHICNGHTGTIVCLYNDSVDVKMDHMEDIVRIERQKTILTLCTSDDRRIERFITAENRYKLPEGSTAIIESSVLIRDVWQVTAYSMPIVVAFAITIHKSQGQTFVFDVALHLCHLANNAPLGAVALSRFKHIANIYIVAYDLSVRNTNRSAMNYVKKRKR
jgi:hypothetical protein